MFRGRGLDRWDLYERCVQNPRDVVPLLRAIHGAQPTVLGEDFCGSALLSAHWVDAVAGGRAIAVDHDADALRRAPQDERIELVHGDVVAATDPARHPTEVVYVGNFSIGERRSRAELLRYLAHARSRLVEGGLFACDVYGGETAFLTGAVEREHRIGDGRVVRYTWEQREADPTTGFVVNALHFEVLRSGSVERTLRDAFVYQWRLWGIPELRDALFEAGFAETEVYAKVPDAIDGDGEMYVRPIDEPESLGDSFEAIVAARR